MEIGSKINPCYSKILKLSEFCNQLSKFENAPWSNRGSDRLTEMYFFHRRDAGRKTATERKSRRLTTTRTHVKTESTLGSMVPHMLHHISFVVTDLRRSAAFYEIGRAHV